MARIVSSTHAEGPQEQDGRRWVREEHTCDNSEVLKFDWLRAEGDPDAGLVAQERAARLNAQFAEREAAQALVAGSKVPLTHYEFRMLFPQERRLLIDRFNVQFEQHPGLTPEQKDLVRSGLEDFRLSEWVVRPFEPQVAQMLGLYQALGLLTAEEAAEILSHG